MRSAIACSVPTDVESAYSTEVAAPQAVETALLPQAEESRRLGKLLAQISDVDLQCLRDKLAISLILPLLYALAFLLLDKRHSAVELDGLLP